MIIDPNNISFEPVAHKYTDENGQELISVSTLIHKYTKEFDLDGSILKRCAEKKGVTPEELKAEWLKINKDSCDYGHGVHAEIEYFIKNGKIQKNGIYKDIVKKFKKIKFKGKLQSEVRLSNLNFRIAGTADLVEFVDNNIINLLDIKTNRALKKTSFFTRGVGFEMMLYPVQHLQSCNFVHYSLQLHIYAILLEELGYWVDEKTLIYITPKERQIKLHPILPLRNEAIAMIKHYNLTKFGKKITI